MERVLHARMPGEASYDGKEWRYGTVCGLVCGPVELALGSWAVNCELCLSDLAVAALHSLYAADRLASRIPPQAGVNPMS